MKETAKRGSSDNNALKFALAARAQAYEEAKAHASANWVGVLFAEDKSYLSQLTSHL